MESMGGMGAQGVYTPPSKKRERIKEKERERAISSI